MKYLLDKRFSQLTTSFLDRLFFKLSTELFPCDYFIEAGAFEASASSNIKKQLPTCDVYAFEANLYNYDYFKDSLQNIHYNNFAISNKSGEIEFNIMLEKKGQAVSLVKTDNSITPRNKKGVVYKQVTVDCVSLDDYFKDKNLSNVSLWIDVEGHGLECLQGADKVLEKTNMIKIEVEEKQYWKDQKLSVDIVKFLETKNFIPVIRDYQSPMQYNILFVKDYIASTEKFRKCYE
jgi:FkbM family methyltransferase